MSYNDLIKRLLATEGRGQRGLLSEAAEAIEELEQKFNALMEDTKKIIDDADSCDICAYVSTAKSCGTVDISACYLCLDEECVCKNCDGSDNWEWRGMQNPEVELEPEPILLRWDEESQAFVEYKKPFMTIECPTEEDYKRFQELIAIGNGQRWIRAEDRLPEMHTETCEIDGETVEYQISDLVVAYTDQGEVAVCKYSDENGERLWWSTDCDRLVVTHWLPLPKEG